MPSGVTGNAAASDAEDSRFDSLEGSVTVDWDSRTTVQLKLMLESLLRHQPNAKTEREKRNTAKSIQTIQNILKERVNARKSIQKS